MTRRAAAAILALAIALTGGAAGHDCGERTTARRDLTTAAEMGA